MSTHASVANKLSTVVLSKPSPVDPVEVGPPISPSRLLPKARKIYGEPLPKRWTTLSGRFCPSAPNA